MSFARFLHRNFVSHTLPSLSSLFPTPRAARCTRSQTTASIAVNRFRTSDGVNSFSNRAAVFFNALPSELRSSSHTQHFMQKFNNFLKDPMQVNRFLNFLFERVTNV